MFLLLAVAFTVVPVVAAPNGSLSFASSGHCLDSGTKQTPIGFGVLNKQLTTYMPLHHSPQKTVPDNLNRHLGCGRKKVDTLMSIQKRCIK